MGAVRDASLPPMGVKPGMTLAQSTGLKDPAGYDKPTDTYTPGFVRGAVEQSRLKAEVPFQQDSALANRQPTPEARTATMADLSKQRIIGDSEERIQAMRSKSDVESARVRDDGKRRGEYLKAVESSTDNINNLYESYSNALIPEVQNAIKARIALAEAQHEKNFGAGVEAPKYSAEDIAAVKVAFPDYDDAKAVRYLKAMGR